MRYVPVVDDVKVARYIVEQFQWRWNPDDTRFCLTRIRVGTEIADDHRSSFKKSTSLDFQRVVSFFTNTHP